MGRFKKRRKGYFLKCFNRLLQKRVSVPTQQYYNVAYTEEKINYLTTKIKQRKKSITTNDKEDVEGSFNSKTPRHNIMYTLFYSNISEFAGDLKETIDKGKYKNHTKYA